MYDRESVEYIVNSDEGRKYFHFFKHMLLGSEEHYYVSLLYNWPRTQVRERGMVNGWVIDRE